MATHEVFIAKHWTALISGFLDGLKGKQCDEALSAAEGDHTEASFIPPSDSAALRGRSQIRVSDRTSEGQVSAGKTRGDRGRTKLSSS